MHRLHGPSGLWTSAMGNRFRELGLHPGEHFEYDPQRGCKFWNPMTCYNAPSFLNKLVKEMPASTVPAIILEVRPFLGATSIGLANALSYAERNGFILSVDTFRGDEGVVGILQRPERYSPSGGATETDIMYFEYLSNVANTIVSPGGYQPSWIPHAFRGEHSTKSVINATKQIVPFPLLTSKAKSTAHWLGRRGWRPILAYINAPRVGVGDYKLDLEHTWRVLGCGGAMAGDGYRIPEVKSALREFSLKRKLLTEPFFLRAAGTRYEQTWEWQDSEEFETRMSSVPNANFTTWVIRNKVCKQVADDDPLPESQLTFVPTEYTLKDSI
jgi:hypothetical protein